MNLQKLDIFITLVETKKMAETAHLLKLSPPTVSFHIRSLEKEYGIKLFRTNAGGYRLTDAGEILYHFAKQLSQTNKGLERAISDYMKGEMGSIKLGASGVPAQLFMPELIHKLAEQYPRVKVSLDVKTAPEIERLLLVQECDFALLMETGNLIEDLVYERITTDHLVLAFSKEHNFSMKNSLEENDFHGQTLLVHTLSSSTKHFSRTWMEKQNFQMEMIELDSVSTIINMLSFGKSVALISKRLIEKDHHLTYVEFNDDSLKRQIFFVYHRNLWINEPLQYFRKLVMQLKDGLR